jgi:hypothetical protein
MPASSADASSAIQIVTEIVACLTQPKYKNKLVVIMAGYEEPMDAFLASTNPGLSSRFSEHLYVEAFTATQAVEVGIQLAAAAGRPLSAGGCEAALTAFTTMAALPGWSSGRDVDTLIKRASRKAALRTRGGAAGAGAGVALTMEAADVNAAAAELLAQPERNVDPLEAASRRSTFGSRQQDDSSSGGSNRPPVRSPCGGGRGGGDGVGRSGSSSTATATAVAEVTRAAEEEDVDSGSPVDLWACLERACVQCGLSASDVAPDLRAGRAPERVVTLVAAELGRPVGEVRTMLGGQAPALLAKVEQAVKAEEEVKERAKQEADDAASAGKLDDPRFLNRQWVCSFCHNSNTDCPYRPRQQGGYFVDSYDA